MLEPGDNVERFTVDAILGEGGMAVVYRVRHRELGSEHALKVLTSAARQIRERLLQEGRAQATLRHPNIVEVRDILDVGGCPGLLMELVDGPSLEVWLESNRPGLPEAEEIFRGIVSAVAHAHTRKLVHRDLKPANVLLSRIGGRWVPKVADFGLAKLLTDDDPNSRKTRSGVAMGTPAYMSPEQIRDAKNTDQRTDVFALGCILYELVTGECCFRREDIASTFNASLSGFYRSPKEFDPTVPDRVLNTIAGCLRTERDQRLADCAALLAVLDGGMLIPAGPSATLAPSVTIGRGATIASSQDTFAPDGQISEPMPRPTRSQADTQTSGSRKRTSSPPPDLRRSQAPEGTGLVVSMAVIVSVFAGLIALVAVGAAGWFWWKAQAKPDVVEAAENPAPVVVQQPPEPAPAAIVEPAAKPAPVKAKPSPRPEPVAVVEPEPEPPPVPKPPPVEREATGTVRYSGDADEVWLVGEAGRYRASGSVPAGSYQIEAEFDGTTVSAGQLVLDEGESVTLKCKAAFKQCRK